ncbi:hypothetical protein INT43_002533 [Umbelopsis isabellina]|uniref:Uncharacterized protein n=1 Tax=Mortierella isabellina TaxID=91625 RepID=A0A8H7UK41_MORIS|nr:hypothetical protein INT43_002533 [Umbelopsis isabellina]
MTSVDMSKLKGIPHLVNAEPALPSAREDGWAKDKPWEELSKLLAPKNKQANDVTESSQDKDKNVEQNIADEDHP